jgi:hypothetical protein
VRTDDGHRSGSHILGGWLDSYNDGILAPRMGKLLDAHSGMCFGDLQISAKLHSRICSPL